MTRVAILGGGIAGLAAAFELEKRRRAGAALDWHLFEASGRLGGTLSTTRLNTAEGEYILEDGPDGWVTEKPWARELAEELGLGSEIIPCNEAERRTYILLGSASAARLVPMPSRMRLMVPEDLAALNDSPLFSPAAIDAYRAEPLRAAELRDRSPSGDESVASFVLRHFGEEVLTRIAAPLLSGVFGGDVRKLSVQAVMPQFVAMEREHGSLIVALQARAIALGTAEALRPTFTSLRRGMGSLAEALVDALPPDRLHKHTRALLLRRSADGWLVRFGGDGAHSCAVGMVAFDELVLATPPDSTRQLLTPVDPEAAALLPTEASSAVLITLCWPESLAGSMQVPRGFGFLVPPASEPDTHRLLAATFAEQKYGGRAPRGGRILRAFFGDRVAQDLAGDTDQTRVDAALRELRSILGPLPAPDPDLTTVRRWPRSLPQYEVGHPDRMRELQTRADRLGQLHLIGNGYHGVGVPDLVREARRAAQRIAADAPKPDSFAAPRNALA